jgi:hypothetical protein
MGLMKCKLVKISHTEFQQDLWNRVLGAWKSPYVVLCKLGSIIDQYGWKSEFAIPFLCVTIEALVINPNI